MSKICYYCGQDHLISDCSDYKKQKFSTQQQDNYQLNFRRPIMYSENEGHIVEYIQVKVLRTTKKGKDENFKDNQNFLVDKEYKQTIRSHKWYKRESDIVDENNIFFKHNFLQPKLLDEELNDFIED